MPIVDLGNGVTALICGGRQKLCPFCHNQYVTKLCDYPLSPRKTCDAGMCNRCATSITHEVDYCPNHKNLRPAAQQSVLPLGGK